MKIVRTISDLRNSVTSWQQDGDRVALIPTMGSLHEAHLALVDAGLEHCQKAVVSIFVNPKQFSPDEDFNNYPRTIEDDIQKLHSLNVDILFIP